jgi:hypothetical protein
VLKISVSSFHRFENRNGDSFTGIFDEEVCPMAGDSVHSRLVVVECSRCSGLHRLDLNVQTRGEVPVFGGGDNAGDRWEVPYTCPITGGRAAATVSVSARLGKRVVGVSAIRAAAAPEGTRPSDEVQIIEDEYESTSEGGTPTLVDVVIQEWVRASASTPRDFCKAMLTACTAAVPVFFAVMKFLGAETAPLRWLAWSGAIPPTLFVCAAITYAVAMQPKFTALTKDEFVKWHHDRLSHMNATMRLATWLYGLAMASTIVLFLLALALR